MLAQGFLTPTTVMMMGAEIEAQAEAAAAIGRSIGQRDRDDVAIRVNGFPVERDRAQLLLDDRPVVLHVLACGRATEQILGWLLFVCGAEVHFLPPFLGAALASLPAPRCARSFA